LGRIILAVSISLFNFVECSSCRGWPGIDGWCLSRYKLQQTSQISEAIDSLHCSNLTQNENYHPCSLSSQSCALVFVDGGWVSGCVADHHGLFIAYSMNSSKQLALPIKATYSKTFSVGSFCSTRTEGSECDQTTILNRAFFQPETTVCCCKTSGCTDRYLRRLSEGRGLHPAKERSGMICLSKVVVLGVVQAMMWSTALIVLIHDYYSRFKVRVVIGEAEKVK
ncbi:hypothetical protein PFISCL1PPCAC_5765, partial [Pristionchus fissidentatus]